MILADTNIFIDFWNGSNKTISDVFNKEEIVICGVIRAELLHGAVSDKDFDNITNLLNAFDELTVENEDWQILGKHLNMLRRSGLTVPFSDAVLATIALKYNTPIWSADKHFKLIQGILTDLKLY